MGGGPSSGPTWTGNLLTTRHSHVREAFSLSDRRKFGFRVWTNFERSLSPLSGYSVRRASSAGSGQFHVELEVKKGRVDTVTVNTTADSAGNSFGSNEIQALVDSVQGLEFGPHLTQAVHKHLSAAAGTEMPPPKRQFFTDCVYT